MNEPAFPRSLGRGRSYVYLLPCRDEDLLKIGFSRDPLDRLRTLHRRFFDFFDLRRGLLIETPRVVDARRIERLLLRTFAEHRATAPLVVPRAAAGHTEWYRGIHAPAIALAAEVCAREGLPLHDSLHDWLRAYLASWSDRLYELAGQLLGAVEYEQHNAPPRRPAAAALRQLLDLHEALEFPLEHLVPAPVLAWYREQAGLHWD